MVYPSNVKVMPVLLLPRILLDFLDLGRFVDKGRAFSHRDDKIVHKSCADFLGTCNQMDLLLNFEAPMMEEHMRKLARKGLLEGDFR